MFWADFGEKCIIVQFLEPRKDGKDRKTSLYAETRRAQRKVLGDTGVQERRWVAFSLEGEFGISPLFA
jgi:hypothetical protein